MCGLLLKDQQENKRGSVNSVTQQDVENSLYHLFWVAENRMGRSELPVMFIIFLHFSLHNLQAVGILTVADLQQGNGICP